MIQEFFQEEFVKALYGVADDVDHYRRGVRLYDVLTALRGPDVYTIPGMEVVKHNTTKRLRYIVFGGEVDEVAFGVSNREPLTQESIDDVEKAVEDINVWLGETSRHLVDRQHISHFAMHTQDAIWATRQHPHWGSVELARKLREVLLGLLS